MKAVRLFLFILVFLFTISLSAVGAEEPAGSPNGTALHKESWPTHLRVLTGPSGGQWHMLGEPIAEALSSSVLPTISRVGGGLSNIESINSKDGDLGFTLRCFLGAASSGEEEYKHIKMDNAVLLANVYPQVLYFLVRKDFAEKHGINSVETLLQKEIPLRFASLKPGTASEFILTLLLEYGYNTNFEKLQAQGWNISFNNYKETADKFVGGELDCFAYTAGTEVPLILEMEKYAPIIVLPLDQDVLDLMSEKFKTNTYIIQPGVYKSVNSPIKTLGDHTCIVVRKDLPTDLVFEITKALWENKAKIADVVKDFGALQADTAMEKDLPMHPGAMEFWSSVEVVEQK